MPQGSNLNFSRIGKKTHTNKNPAHSDRIFCSINTVQNTEPLILAHIVLSFISVNVLFSSNSQRRYVVFRPTHLDRKDTTFFQTDKTNRILH